MIVIYLAFIDAGISVLRVFDLQNPVLRMRMMNGTETLIGCVCVPSDRQQMDIAVPHP